MEYDGGWVGNIPASPESSLRDSIVGVYIKTTLHVAHAVPLPAFGQDIRQCIDTLKTRISLCDLCPEPDQCPVFGLG